MGGPPAPPYFHSNPLSSTGRRGAAFPRGGPGGPRRSFSVPPRDRRGAAFPRGGPGGHGRAPSAGAQTPNRARAGPGAVGPAGAREDSAAFPGPPRARKSGGDRPRGGARPRVGSLAAPARMADRPFAGGVGRRTRARAGRVCGQQLPLLRRESSSAKAFSRLWLTGA